MSDMHLSSESSGSSGSMRTPPLRRVCSDVRCKVGKTLLFNFCWQLYSGMSCSRRSQRRFLSSTLGLSNMRCTGNVVWFVLNSIPAEYYFSYVTGWTILIVLIPLVILNQITNGLINNNPLSHTHTHPPTHNPP